VRTGGPHRLPFSRTWGNSMSANGFPRLCGAVLLAVTFCLLGSGTAGAHVTAYVYGAAPEKGGDGAIVLRVPNEGTQPTVRIEVTVPAGYDITRVRTRPVPGWTAEIGRAAGGVVTSITWSTSDRAIPPGDEHYDEFSFTASPLPSNVDRILLPTRQVYADGTLTDWAQEQTGDAEPKYPAPVVALAEPSGTAHGHGHTQPTSGPAWLVTVPLGSALLIMVVFGVIALTRPRRRSPK